MGATSPGRWQPWQFFCKIGRTSLLNVTVLEAAPATIPIRQPTKVMCSGLIIRCLLGERSLGRYHTGPPGGAQGSMVWPAWPGDNGNWYSMVRAPGFLASFILPSILSAAQIAGSPAVVAGSNPNESAFADGRP